MTATAECVWGGDRLDLDAYLERTGYTGALDPTVKTLRGLHRAHVAAITFENLDVALDREVRLDPDSVQRKLVTERRGGYCYEQNSLFAAVLERLGFAVTAHGARVRTAGPALRPITHVLLRVVVDGAEWLADTGFGGLGPMEPVELRVGTPTWQGGWAFEVAEEAGGVRVLRSLGARGWSDLYAFAPNPLYPVDVVVLNHYTSTHPLSRFTGQLVVQRATPQARYVLVRDELTVTRPGAADGAEERRKVAPEDLARVLESTFGLVLDAADAERLSRLAAHGEARGVVVHALHPEDEHRGVLPGGTGRQALGTGHRRDGGAGEQDEDALAVQVPVGVSGLGDDLHGLDAEEIAERRGPERGGGGEVLHEEAGMESVHGSIVFATPGRELSGASGRERGTGRT
ncbi:arylamine N-acetyltransferase family protein [Streptomyces sp. H39-S7]|uniref:arylamine N-acetyltransferase family protein n=1 Tax=Streptomyces sp. H39-S7 TaxID=3004357 RepID=UPI0022AF17D9|nr:arylamine N-acetyltransferase [Streptomyces sp. H39-S7]MCZ4119350.1 arylamine N-acetyltransferase [Streptomyces sp. H39-S7]